MKMEPNALALVLSRRGQPLRLSISLLNFANNNRFLTTSTNQQYFRCYSSIKYFLFSQISVIKEMIRFSHFIFFIQKSAKQYGLPQSRARVHSVSDREIW
jgi:hypothetical protein